MAVPILTEAQKSQKRGEHVGKITKLQIDLEKSLKTTQNIRDQLDAAIRDLNQEHLKL